MTSQSRYNRDFLLSTTSSNNGKRFIAASNNWAFFRTYFDRLPKRTAELREQGRRRRGRPRLRRKDCVKRDVNKAGEEGDWKKETEEVGKD